MSIFNDLIGFLKTLTFIDLVFFFSVVILLILVVTLIYFIRINDEVFETKELKEMKEEEKKETNVMAYDEQEEAELLDLASITKALEENKTMNIDLTEYEQEQEERAIISYDELLKKTNNTINYEKEELIDNDITVKKVDLENLVSNIVNEEPKLNVQVISYDKEEDFLKALKQLQKNLN